MSDEDIKNLKMRNYELSNSINAYQQENIQLKQRVAELYEWTQQAQLAFQQKDSQIQSLNSEIQKFQQVEQQRLQNRGEVTIDELYEQVQQLEVKNRDLGEKIPQFYDIIETIYISSKVDRNILSKIEEILRQDKDPQKILLIEMKKNPSASYSELSRTTGLNEQKIKIAADQLRRKGLIKEFGSGKGIAFTKTDTMTTLTDVSEWKSLTNPKDLFNALIEYVKVTDQNIHISEALKEFRDKITSLIGTPSYMYEISKAISNFRMQMHDKDQLIRRIITWQEKWESSIQGIDTYGTTIEDPSSWSSGLAPDEIFSSMSRFIQRASNTNIASALEKIRDILHEKHGHAIYLVEIAREASKWKMSSQNKDNLLKMLKDWNTKANIR